MPYAVMVSYLGSGSQRVWEPTGLVYEDGAQAGLYVKGENLYCAQYYPARRYRAVKITDNDPLLWREREQIKFDQGIYQKPPWDDYFSQTGMYEHIDPDDPTKIRFIASHEDGMAGRYTSMSPGRFIRKYLHGEIRSDLLDKWCAQMGLDQTTSKLKLAYTADEILFVYQNGPHSCMAYPKDHPVFEMVEKHPVTVYGDSDLAVAYIERYGEITARCLVWPEKKLHGRIYGDRERILERLRENGYVENWNFVGAKIHQFVNTKNNILIVPYIDGDDMGVIPEGDEWLVLSDKPHVICKEPNGMATTAECTKCGQKGVWLTKYFGPDDDYDEPEWICSEGCKN